MAIRPGAARRARLGRSGRGAAAGLFLLLSAWFLAARRIGIPPRLAAFGFGTDPDGYSADTPALVHGSLPKHGPLASVAAVGAGGTRARLFFPPTWHAARLAGGRVGPPPSKWCPIMFNDKYRFIYPKPCKAAGTSLLTFFTDCREPHAADYCLTQLDYDNATMVHDLLAAWPNYFVFSFSRNVLRRAVSQYQYLSLFMGDRPDCPRLSWGEFCIDPYRLGDLCPDEGTLAAAASAGNASKLCCTQSAQHHYMHAAPQATCFTTANGRSALDWLGRVEDFQEDFAALVGLLNARPGVPKLPTDAPLKKTNYNASPCQNSSGGGGGAAGTYTRQLRWELADGMENPCDRNEFFRGRFARCYQAMLQFYAEDVQLPETLVRQ